MKKIHKLTGIVALCTCLTTHANTNFSELNKELEIMNSVLATTLKQKNRDEAIRFRTLETNYLASQGVVFHVTTSRNSAGFSLGLSQFMPTHPQPPLPPRAPIIIDGNGRNITIDVDDNWGHVIEDTLRQVENAFRQSNDQLREVRDESRELAWEAREYERRLRDLNFEARNADGERKQNLEQEIEQVNTEVAELKRRQAELEEYASALETEQQEQVEKQRETYEQANKAFLSSFEERIADTLCRYGAGLRALPENEYISFVLKNFNSGERRETQDRIYVFSNSEVKKCVQERIEAEELLAKATVYEF